MSGFLGDIRYGLRLIRRSPGPTLAAILALALGIGANAAIFSAVHAVLLRPLSYDSSERLMEIQEINPKQGSEPFNVSYPNFTDWREQSRSFEKMVAVRSGGATLSGGSTPERVQVALATSDLVDLLGVPPLLGRGFLPGEDLQGSERVAVLSHSLWRERFGSNSDLSGKTVLLDGDSYAVVGVMPPGFEFPSEDTDVWINIGPLTGFMKNRAVHVLSVVARVKPEVTREQAATEMATIAAGLQQAHLGEDPEHLVQVGSLRESLVGDVRPALLALLGAVGFVLLIACANVANLLLARSEARRKEMAVRTALGAGRGRLVRQLLTESALLGLAGGGLGLLLALWGVDLIAAGPAGILPRAKEVAVDGTVLVFTLALSLLTALLSGVAPALQAAGRAPAAALPTGVKGAGGGREHRRLGRALVVVEVALSLVLLMGAGLLMRSFSRLQQVALGFRSDDLLVATVSLPGDKYSKPSQLIAFYQELATRLEGLPGVRTASAASALPISLGDAYGNLTLDGKTFPPGETPAASFRRVLPNYFQAMGIPVVQGREFGEQDRGQEPKAVLINQSMARRFWPEGDAVGKRIKVGPAESEPWLTVVGVVGDVRNVRPDADPTLATYEPFAQRPRGIMQLVVRTDGDPLRLAGAVRSLVLELEPGAPVYDLGTMEQRIAVSLAPRRFNTLLLKIFAAVAVALAGVGIYSVMAFSVAQRTHEIGVRMALGAQRRDVLRLVLRQGVVLGLGGVLTGVAGSLILTRVLASMLFEVSAHDPATLTVVSILLLAVALLASYIPARRAAHVDPMVALRCE